MLFVYGDRGPAFTFTIPTKERPPQVGLRRSLLNKRGRSWARWNLTDQQDGVAAFPSEAATSVKSMTDAGRRVSFETC